MSLYIIINVKCNICRIYTF